MKSKTVKIIMMFLCVIIVILLCVISFMVGKIGSRDVNSDTVENTIDYEVSSMTFKNIFFKYPAKWHTIDEIEDDYIYFYDTEAEDIPEWRSGEHIHVRMEDDEEVIEKYTDNFDSVKDEYKEFDIKEDTLKNGIDYKKIIAVLDGEELQYEIHYMFVIDNKLYWFKINSDAEILKDTDTKVYNMINSIQYK